MSEVSAYLMRSTAEHTALRDSVKRKKRKGTITMPSIRTKPSQLRKPSHILEKS